MHRIIILILITLLSSLSLWAQSPTATIDGRVLDSAKAVIQGATIRAINLDTNLENTAQTNSAGLFTMINLPPGSYRIEVSKPGFRTIVNPGVVLHVQDVVALNFDMPVGSVLESITVSVGAPLVNTESAAVSTVVDRSYVENMPLNGRSFQDLIRLTPGVVTNNPQSASSIGEQGEFSVNGQRTESNYYSVDGVSANVGANTGVLFDATSSGVSGSLPGPTALGTTHALVSIDALEEFRVQSSTYSAEYGRNPGGQFSFVTRSGTNQWHGTASDYLRNGALDSNDWFNDYFQQTQPALRQNDFGGTLGGPLDIPGLYRGKGKTFVFFSYEGLRLVQPQAASINYVPDASVRQSAPGALQPVLNAFPVANGPALGNGLAEFVSTWSNPSQIDAISVRLDHSVNSKLRLFFRFSDTPSTANTRGTGALTPGTNNISHYTSRTYTAGATNLLSNRASNDFRLNYSSNRNALTTQVDGFGGGQATNLIQLQGLNSAAALVDVSLSFPGHFVFVTQTQESGIQRQWNLVDTVAMAFGHHQFKFGVDYRRLTPVAKPYNPAASYFFSSEASLQANSADFAVGTSEAAAYPLYQNFAAFAENEWKVLPRINLSMGLRWEVNPAPGVTQGLKPYTVEGTDLSTLALAPQGAPLWKTTWFNFAPRLGAAYVLRENANLETVVRTGVGLFFDTAQQAGSSGFQGPGFTAQAVAPQGAAFPLPVEAVAPPIVNPPGSPYNTSVFAFPMHLQLPYTLQWNVSIQQALSKAQALTISYVGSHAGRLLEQNAIQGGALNPNFSVNGISFYKNGLTSDYNSLQAQFQRRISAGLQALASYTLSHSIDYGSTNIFLPYERSSSDFDVRHNFSGAVSYELPTAFEDRLLRALLRDWAIDDRFTARTGFPVTLNGNPFIDPMTGIVHNTTLDLVPGQPFYVYGPQCTTVYASGLTCPGGRAINPNAFSPPTSGVGNAPRNLVRGFGSWQMDLALRREFPIYERLKLQFRAEAFNIFNHPNFGAINPNYCAAGPGCTFGQATSTLAQSLGVLSPIYQTGGPRSFQFALKLIF